MTRFLHLLSGLIVWTLFAVSGGALIYANGFQVEEGLLGLFRSQGSALQAMEVGGVMVLLVLLHLSTFAPRRPKVKFISFDSDDGAVSISVNAVRDFIRKLGDEFGAVISLDPKIRAEKDLINIDLDVKIQTGTRIPELSHILQNRVRESIRDGLGIAEVREIKVRIQEIVGAPPASHTH
jgi:uncharacterized alkaline shock family protein YloU